MIVEEVLSARKKPLFRINDYMYEIEKKNKNGTLNCRCIKKRLENCLARASIIKNPEPVVLKLSRDHNHGPDIRDRIHRTATLSMKQAALSHPEKSVRQVYDEQLGRCVQQLKATDQYDPEEIGVALPSFNHIKSSIQRTRAELRPKLPRSSTEINLQGLWTKTTDGNDFLLFDDGSDRRVLGFTTHENLRILCDSTACFMDGTFRVVPTLFAQLYSIHAFYKQQMMPLIYFLLPDKSKETYIRMFALIQDYAVAHNLSFQPSTLRLDYEVATLQAIQEKLPATVSKGCHFHFCQALWRNFQRFGLVPHYKDKAVRRFLRCTMALSFVPMHQIDEAWLLLDAESPNIEHPAYTALDEFKLYFINTWLENGNVFPRTLWNQYRNFGTRTTNHLEAWHRALNRTVKQSHVNLFEMVTHLQKDEERFRSARLLLDVGNAPPAMRARYVKMKARLTRLVDEFETDQITLHQYIKRVAYNLPSFDDNFEDSEEPDEPTEPASPIVAGQEEEAQLPIGA